MNRFLGILFYVIIILSFCSPVFAWPRYDVNPIVYTGPSTFNAYACINHSATIAKSDITIEWDSVGGDVYYEVQLYNVERNIYTLLGIVKQNPALIKCEITFKLPNRTGHYVTEVRSIRYFSDTEKVIIRAMTRTQLLSFIESRQVDLVVIVSMTDAQIADAMILKGMTSRWAITSNPNDCAMISGVRKCFWIIGKPAAPGTVIITK